MTHELAHQWYGDSVSPATWSDIWLNEGHATWYELTWAAQRGVLADGHGLQKATSLDAFMRQVYALGDRYRAADGPVALPLDRAKQFSDNVYYGGALVLYALQQKVRAGGVRAARTRVGPSRGRASRGSTDDFIAFASASTGQDLGGFLRAWLYGTTTPPMPGHPDWTVEPVKSAAGLGSRARLFESSVPGVRRRALVRGWVVPARAAAAQSRGEARRRVDLAHAITPVVAFTGEVLPRRVPGAGRRGSPPGWSPPSTPGP